MNRELLHNWIYESTYWYEVGKNALWIYESVWNVRRWCLEKLCFLTIEATYIGNSQSCLTSQSWISSRCLFLWISNSELWLFCVKCYILEYLVFKCWSKLDLETDRTIGYFCARVLPYSQFNRICHLRSRCSSILCSQKYCKFGRILLQNKCISDSNFFLFLCSNIKIISL